MGFFSFIESFFFLSLGITFVLIFLMVFHFKQRVEQLEKKSENMLEVCNGLVQQIHGLKTFCISSNRNGDSFLAPSSSDSSKLSENITFSTCTPIPIPDLVSSSFQKIVVEEFDDSEKDEDEDEDEDEEEDEEMDVSDELDTFPLETEENPTVLENVESVIEEVVFLQEENSSNMIPIDLEPEEPLVEDPLIEDPLIEDPLIEDPQIEENLSEEIDIKNLSLQQLRQLASNKGLSTNPNKMKKQELLQLLQKSSTEQKPSTEKSLRDLAHLL